MSAEDPVVFPKEKFNRRTLAERKRLDRLRNERTTAKERLKNAHHDIELAMSAPRAVKMRRLAKTREYAVEVKLGFQHSLDMKPGPGTCCPNADCDYERWDRRRCSQCGRACTESCDALRDRRAGEREIAVPVSKDGE